MSGYDSGRYLNAGHGTFVCLDCSQNGITSREDHDRLVEHVEPPYNSCPSHCCALHGCKYGYRRCPIVTRKARQEHPCERCDDDANSVVFNERQNADILALIRSFPDNDGFQRLQARIDDDRAKAREAAGL